MPPDTTVYQSERNTIGTGQLSDLQLPAFRIGTSQPGFLFWSHRSCWQSVRKSKCSVLFNGFITLHFHSGCAPCDSVYLENIVVNEEDSCCYRLVVNNYHNGDLYYGMQICAIDTNAVITLNNLPTSEWSTFSLSANAVYLSLWRRAHSFGHPFTAWVLYWKWYREAYTTYILKWMIDNMVSYKQAAPIALSCCAPEIVATMMISP